MTKTRNKLIGIYAIKCLSNMKIYIGSSKDIDHRFSVHKNNLSVGKHHNTHLQNAYNKYGKDMFAYFMVEQCHEKDIIEKENWWMNKLNTRNPKFGFNCGSAEHAPMTGRTHTEETKKKMSAAKIGKHFHTEASKNKIGMHSRGRLHSEQTKKLMSSKQKGRTFTESSKKKISDSVKKYWQSKIGDNNE